MQPTFGHGKICYLEIPASNIQTSADFYKNVFHWNIRTRSDGSTSFDDGVGQVSGVWTLTRKPQDHPTLGIAIHIMVDNAESTLASITNHGGQIIQLIGADHPEITAKFRDPAGNILGIYQNPA